MASRAFGWHNMSDSNDTIGVGDVTIEPDDGSVVEYIRENHYSGTCNPISNRWALRTEEGKEIVGGIVFANPMSEQVRSFVAGGEQDKHRVTELHRLYTDDRCGKNVESWFIARALKRLKEKKSKYRFVVSYADGNEGHVGTIYQATNAIYTGTTDDTSGTHKYYLDGDGNRRAKRQEGSNVTMEDAKARGWKVMGAHAKHRYIFPLPDQYESRQDVVDDMGPDSLPYPDGIA